MTRPRKTKTSTRQRPLALVYVRVSTADQADNGASLDAQRTMLEAEADRRGWDVELVADEGLSGKNLNRPALVEALERLDRGEADTLMSVRLDRISRSVADFAGLLDRAGKRGWGLVLLSPALDLADPAGRFTANVLASAAQYERELIGARTREGMAQRRAEGWPNGKPTGRPRALPEEIRARIVAEHAAGAGWSELARRLNAEGIPTAAGGKQWHPASVRSVVVGRSVSDADATVTA
jgi:DNA invertase Pin-like site-specific DNA recombinase